MKSRKSFIMCALTLMLSIQTSFGKDKIEPIPNGIQLETPKLNLKVQFYSDNTVRVKKWLPGTNPDVASLVVLQTVSTKLNVQVKEETTQIILISNTLHVVINKVDGNIEYIDNKKVSILKESGAPEIKPANVKNEKAFSIKQLFELTSDEGVYGLGQHQNGYLNYRGKTVKLVQTNTEAVTPFFISTKNYGIYWDNYSKTIFTDNAKETSLWSDVASAIDYYFIAGENMDGVIAGYRNLTGQAPMYGKWAYGYWQSKEHYENRAELLSVAREYRKRQIPIDNIIQDWDTWEGTENWNQIFFDAKKFPQPKEMMDSLHQLNFHAIVSVWCSFGPKTQIYKEMGEKGFLLPTVGWAKFKYFDVYNPAAHDLFWQHINKGFFSIGLDGWWMDSTEPDIVNANNKEATEYELKRMPDNHIGSFARYLNPYSLLATENVYKNQRKVTEQKRAYILTRSTFAGQQRAAATTWSGDIGASWSIYKNQIAAGLNHSMSGIPYWTFDIGAFVLGGYNGVFCEGGKEPSYQELYTRMFQFGAFCPIFRSHGSETPREIWQFGDFTPTLVKFDNLRYRLLPYIYSLASQVTNNGYTIMRGLPMDFANDKKTYSVDDQFMFGSSMMVCPVTEYMLHRPPMSSEPVTSNYFKTEDGKTGLHAKYYKDITYKELSLEKIDSSINVNWYATGRPDYVTDSTLAIKWSGKLIPTQTGKHQFHIKCYGPKHLYINGKLVPLTYHGVEAYTEKVDLEAGKEYDFALETENGTPGALRCELFWKTPAIFAQEKVVEKREQTRNVYLPANTQWVDFWTGTSISGGQTITSDAPIDKIPIFVKAGSIIPLGPYVQYSTEKQNEPIEIRIYQGDNGSFELYEDENDNYNYEKGAFSTISFNWNEAKHQLTIGKRKGTFAGMQQKRVFNVVVVNKTKGTGIDPSGTPDKTISYDGNEVVVKL